MKRLPQEFSIAIKELFVVVIATYGKYWTGKFVQFSVNNAAGHVL